MQPCFSTSNIIQPIVLIFPAEILVHSTVHYRKILREVQREYFYLAMFVQVAYNVNRTKIPTGYS